MEDWRAVAPGLKMPALDHLGTSTGVNIQCTKCSDFVVGKQTNFNGPVTIISCADIMKQRTTVEKSEEELIIRDKILTQSAAVKMTKLAEEKEKDMEENMDKWRRRVLEKLMSRPRISLFVCFGLLLSSAVALAVFIRTPEEGSHVRCLPIGDTTCIYSGLPWETPSILPILPDPPLPYVILFQTHGEFCYDFKECLKVIGILYGNELDKAGCSFFVGSEGNVYVGQGWNRRWANSLKEVAVRALRVCFIGEYLEEFPTYPQVVAVTALIRYAVENNYVSRNYVLAASNATSCDNCLGVIYDIIKRWPNFSENPF